MWNLICAHARACVCVHPTCYFIHFPRRDSKSCLHQAQEEQLPLGALYQGQGGRRWEGEVEDAVNVLGVVNSTEILEFELEFKTLFV